MKFLTSLLVALAMLIPNSGATQEQDPIDSIIDWQNASTVMKCSMDRFSQYVYGLDYWYGQTELFLGRSRVNIFDYEIRQFRSLEGTVAVLVNQDTGTFTLIILFEDGSFCEIITGLDFIPYSP